MKEQSTKFHSTRIHFVYIDDQYSRIPHFDWLSALANDIETLDRNTLCILIGFQY